MEPRIQYAKTSDGVSIAYTDEGEGLALLRLPTPPFSRIMRSRYNIRDGYVGLAKELRLITYDSRGCGYSQREVADFSLDAMILDIEAVAAAAGVERFVSAAWDDGVPVAIAHATRYPTRVSHLVLIDGWATAADINHTSVFQAETALRHQDWMVYTETMGRVLLGLEDDMARAFGAYMRGCVEPETLRKIYGSAFGEWDVVELLGKIDVPTLVIQSANHPFQPMQAGQRLASAIPKAEFVITDKTLQDRDNGVVPLIREFLGLDSVISTGQVVTGSGNSLKTMLFTDLASSTALTQRLGDAKAQELVRAHNTIVRGALGAHGGSEIKHTGDGIMASFPTASGALECAVTIQQAIEGSRAKGQGPSELAVHIGLNAGEPVAEESDLFGTSVQLARRICDHASSGQILVSNVVRELSAGKGFSFADIGEVAPKGFEEPVRLYEVRWREEG